MGNALARMEGRIALEEILKRFPNWDSRLAERGEVPDHCGPRLGCHADDRPLTSTNYDNKRTEEPWQDG